MVKYILLDCLLQHKYVLWTVSIRCEAIHNKVATGPMSDPKEFLGKRIKSLRQSRRLSQAMLAEKMGVHTTYVSSIERGKENPTLDIFIKLALALEIELSELFCYDHERSPKELKQFIFSALKEPDEEKLRIVAKFIGAIYR
jgi:transcriptional regulator with XRE-family HTH domain